MRRLITGFAASLFVLVTYSASAAELIMVEEPGCPWCAKWERELGDIYPKTREGKYAPLRKVQIHETRHKETQAKLGFKLTRPVTFTPTFLLIEDGAEVARLQGYPGEDFFWGLLEKMLIEETDFVALPATEATEDPAN